MAKNKEKLLDDDSAGEPEVQVDEPATKGKRILLILVPIIIAVISAIVYAAVFFLKGSGSEEKAKEVKETSVKADYVFIDMDDIIVSLSSSASKKNFLKISLALQIKDKETADIINTKIPMINDSFQLFLRELRPSELSGSAGVIMLKSELLKRVNKVVAPEEVIDVLFKEILLS
jgi:flagellar FliL protein